MMSVTKSFTGLVAEMLIAEGRLDENKLVTDYVPELEGSAYDGATMRNLLNMEIGIDFAEIYDDPSSTIYQFSYAAGFRPVPPGVRLTRRCTSSCLRCARRANTARTSTTLRRIPKCSAG